MEGVITSCIKISWIPNNLLKVTHSMYFNDWLISDITPEVNFVSDTSHILETKTIQNFPQKITPLVEVCALPVLPSL